MSRRNWLIVIIVIIVPFAGYLWFAHDHTPANTGAAPSSTTTNSATANVPPIVSVSTDTGQLYKNYTFGFQFTHPANAYVCNDPYRDGPASSVELLLDARLNETCAEANKIKDLSMFHLSLIKNTKNYQNEEDAFRAEFPNASSGQARYFQLGGLKAFGGPEQLAIDNTGSHYLEEYFAIVVTKGTLLEMTDTYYDIDKQMIDTIVAGFSFDATSPLWQ